MLSTGSGSIQHHFGSTLKPPELSPLLGSVRHHFGSTLSIGYRLGSIGHHFGSTLKPSGVVVSTRICSAPFWIDASYGWDLSGTIEDRCSSHLELSSLLGSVRHRFGSTLRTDWDLSGTIEDRRLSQLAYISIATRGVATLLPSIPTKSGSKLRCRPSRPRAKISFQAVAAWEAGLPREALTN